MARIPASTLRKIRYSSSLFMKSLGLVDSDSFVWEEIGKLFGFHVVLLMRNVYLESDNFTPAQREVARKRNFVAPLEWEVFESTPKQVLWKGVEVAVVEVSDLSWCLASLNDVDPDR